jgi:hypothetical protein
MHEASSPALIERWETRAFSLVEGFDRAARHEH